MVVIQVKANDKQMKIELVVKFRNGYKMRLVTPKMAEDSYIEAKQKTIKEWKTSILGYGFYKLQKLI